MNTINAKQTPIYIYIYMYFKPSGGMSSSYVIFFSSTLLKNIQT